ncbi:hypothetical protein F5Y15DRAFT_366605 [Xylariaceae sp. FL0016]|nr:hypothetical protein F5Y15DRAFT_366605 [Xylariaceae sp. FL0016]
MRLWPSWRRASSNPASATDDIRLGSLVRRSTREPSRLPTDHHPDLQSLPAELLLLVLEDLDLQSLLALRQTCQVYRHVISQEFIRVKFTKDGRPRPILRSVCMECLTLPGLERLILDVTKHPSTWRSICFRCWRDRLSREYHLNPWPVVQFANGTQGYICQFCSWPVQGDSPEYDKSKMHATCNTRRQVVVLTWLVMAFLQFGLGVLAGVLAWTKYRDQPGVLIPASIDFGLAVLAVAVFMIRITTKTEKTYARAIAIELFITIIRLPPVAYTARETILTRLQAGLFPKFGFGVFLINLVFRFLDFVGHVLLNGGYDPRKVFLANLPKRKKTLFAIGTVMVWFAYIPF